MAQLVTAPAAVATSSPGSYVEWGAVIAGAVTAAALSFLLLTFGSAVGLSLSSPWPHAGVSGLTLVILATLFAILVQVGSFAAGGYIAGRMRARWHDAVATESQFRDGAHGFLVWALGIVIGAVIAVGTVGSAAKTGAQLGATVAGGIALGAGAAAGGAANGAMQGSNPMDYTVDLLFRPAAAEPATPQAAVPGAALPGAMPAASPQSDPGYRGQAARILSGGFARGDVQSGDREYLAKLVAARTGLSQQDAQARVDQTITQAREAAARAETEARIAADKARKAGILAAFLAAAALLVSAGAAAAAAGLGRPPSRRKHRHPRLRHRPPVVSSSPNAANKPLPPLPTVVSGSAMAAEFVCLQQVREGAATPRRLSTNQGGFAIPPALSRWGA